jgi:hypothetical protein
VFNLSIWGYHYNRGGINLKKALYISNIAIVAICCFGIIINMLHYVEVRREANIDFDIHYNNFATKVEGIRETLGNVDIENYNGDLSKLFLNEVEDNLTSCLKKIESSYMFSFQGRQKVDIKDIYNIFNDLNFQKGCSEEFSWFFTVKDKEGYGAIEREQFRIIAPFLERMVFLNLVNSIKIEDDLWRTNSYHIIFPFGFSEQDRTARNIHLNYLSMVWKNNVNLSIVWELSNWLLLETDGGNSE